MTEDVPFPDLGRADGPWSLADAPHDQVLVSFGPLLVPLVPTLSAVLEADPTTRRAASIFLVVDECQVQLAVLAGRRGAEMWSDIRRAITRRVDEAGGTSHVVEGPWGPELLAELPVKDEPGLVETTTRRYVGIAGDGWILRASIGGAGVISDRTNAKIDALLSHCAVDRGDAVLKDGTVMDWPLPKGPSVPASTAEAAEA